MRDTCCAEERTVKLDASMYCEAAHDFRQRHNGVGWGWGWIGGLLGRRPLGGGVVGRCAEEGGRHGLTKHCQAHLQLWHAQDKGVEAVRGQEDMPEGLLAHASDVGAELL